MDLMIRREAQIWLETIVYLTGMEVPPSITKHLGPKSDAPSGDSTSISYLTLRNQIPGIFVTFIFFSLTKASAIEYLPDQQSL